MSAPATPLEYLAKTGALPQNEPEYPAPLYWLWLADLLGPANLHTGQVLDAYGTAKEAWEARDDEAFAQMIGAPAVRRLKKGGCPADYADLPARCARLGIALITFGDPRYPLALSRIPDPPLVLYCTGDVSLLNSRRTVGMVGSRAPTAYGVTAAAQLGDQLAQGGAVIVSGMAGGLDSECHKAALRAGTPTIAVLGTPIDKTYPTTNTELRSHIEACGAVVSEYKPGMAYNYQCSFLQRNRIIAALSVALVVVEAQLQSGTMSTVGHAERYGRPVYAVPGSIFSPLSQGTNELLRSGRAKLLASGGDVLARLGSAPAPQPAAPAAAAAAPAAPAPKPALSENARRALACLGPKPIGLEALAEQCGLPTSALLGALTSLQLSGWIVTLPGRRYQLK